ncbi:hypothetical protein N2152v2_001219 [Parachlorella kessleri]
MTEEPQQLPLPGAVDLAAAAEEGAAVVTPGAHKRPAEEHEEDLAGASHPAKSPRLADVLPDSLPGSAEGGFTPSQPAAPGAEQQTLELLRQHLKEARAEAARWREESESTRRELDAALRKVALLEGLVGGTGEANAKLAAQTTGNGPRQQQAANGTQEGGGAPRAGEATLRSLQTQLNEARRELDQLRQAAKGHLQKITHYEQQLKHGGGGGAADGPRRSGPGQRQQGGYGGPGRHPSPVPSPAGLLYGGGPAPPHMGAAGMPLPPQPPGALGGYAPPPGGPPSWPGQPQPAAGGGYYGPGQQPPGVLDSVPPGQGGGYYDPWSQQPQQQPQLPPTSGAGPTPDGYWAASAPGYPQGPPAGPAAAAQPAAANQQAPYYTQQQPLAAGCPPDVYGAAGPAVQQPPLGAYPPPSSGSISGGVPPVPGVGVASSGPPSGGGGGGRGADVDVDAIWRELDPRKRDVIERFARSYPAMVNPSQAKDMCITDFRDMTEPQLEGFFMWLAGHCNPSKHLRYPGGFIRVKHTEWKRVFSI